MNPFQKFGHFIAYFVPGVVVFVTVLLGVSILFNKNYLIKEYCSTDLPIFLVGSIILGILIDEARHVWYDDRIEEKFAKKEGVDQKKISYPEQSLGVDLYKLLQDDYYYIFEFDKNMSIALIPLAIGVAVYLFRFNIVSGCLSIILGSGLFGIAGLFWRFGNHVYQQYSEAVIAALEDFKAPIRFPHEGVYTRIQPSKIHGVGVFAIRPIPKSTNIFQHDNTETVDININEITNIDDGLKKLYDDFSIIGHGKYKCPKNFNNLTVSWYLNDSDESHPANVSCDAQYNFWAIRDIEEGKELLVDSSTYSEQPYRT